MSLKIADEATAKIGSPGIVVLPIPMSRTATTSLDLAGLILGIIAEMEVPR